MTRKKTPKNILLEMQKRRAKMENPRKQIEEVIATAPWTKYHYARAIAVVLGTLEVVAMLGVFASLIWGVWDGVSGDDCLSNKVAITCGICMVPPIGGIAILILFWLWVLWRRSPRDDR
jgi:hypothetical protein